MKIEKNLVNIFVIIFVLLGFINYFYSNEILDIISAGILVLVLLRTVSKLSKVIKLAIAIMFIFGVSLLLYTGVNAREWLRAFLLNRNLLILLICAPMISLPFYYQDYQGELKILSQARMRNVLGFLVLVSIFTHFLSVIISLGAVLIAYTLMEPLATLYNGDRAFLKTLIRSHVSSGFWSPAWASVIIYSTVPGVKWVTVIPVALAFSVLFNAINLLGIYIETRRYPQNFNLAEPPSALQPDRKKLVTMLILALVMISAIVIFSAATGWDLMFIVPVVALFFPLIAALVQKFGSAYASCMKNYYDVSLVKVREQIALFSMAGFLARALDVSGAALALTGLLPAWLRSTPPAMIAAIVLIMTLPGLIGIHPSTTGVTLVTVLQPAALGLTNYTFALAMLLGWVIGMMAAPFSGIALILSGANGKNSFENSLLLNWIFAIICTVVFSLLISLIGPMMG